MDANKDSLNKRALFKSIKKSCFDKIISLGSNISDQVALNIISEIVFEETRKVYLTVVERSSLETIIFNSLRRLGPLQPLIEDESVTEIMVNGKDNVYLERDGRIEHSDVRFDSEEDLLSIINKIVKEVGREVNQSSPIVDARLIDGSRVSIVLPPVSLTGPVITIRKFPAIAMTLEQLLDWHAISDEAAEFLHKLVIAKYNIFVVGGTGTGKTTFLNALCNCIPRDERIITIEDSAELRIVNVPNLVSLETKNATASSGTEISIRALIKSSLRMRPDRIIVGEVRGPEALDMLQAMNTGHDGSLSTGHANSTQDMLSRLETMILSDSDFPLESVKRQIASSLDIMIFLGRLRDKSRKVLEISEVLDYSSGVVRMNKLYEFLEQTEDHRGKVVGELKNVGQLQQTGKLKKAGIVL
ncbi:MAG: Flp pilus assembly complex ATPase component TadA [Clostridiales bacterium]|nr:Flp pilus assembly complex ATPase component TadA [Clostridiales bacterium]